jgi:plastocyanin
MRRLGVIAVLALTAAALMAAVSASAGSKTEKVQLSDVGGNFFVPDFVKIRKGDRVKWIAGPEASESHDVKLTTAPKGVKKGKFRSPTLSPGSTFAKRFKKPGKYHFICTFHFPQMQMDVRVRR